MNFDYFYFPGKAIQPFNMKQEVTKRLPAENLAEPARCSVVATLRLFATKWKPCILCYLSAGSLRYNALHKAIPNISRKMLSEHLRELEQDQLDHPAPVRPKEPAGGVCAVGPRAFTAGNPYTTAGLGNGTPRRRNLDQGYVEPSPPIIENLLPVIELILPKPPPDLS
ncbi:winged helix-turn-helix transcriptional regulator [Puia sp. P3]|uniref:winged helix-turn-helix transcriptional regulator n=1 Tax=Puia sp. P3 TaxID=3423952 RepID=UPI003D6719C7